MCLAKRPKRAFWFTAKVTDWATVLSLPTAVVACLFGYLAYKATWDVADLSGALDKPTLTLGIGTNRVPAGSPIPIAFGTPRLGDPNTVSIISMPFRFANEGKKSIDSATLTFRFSSMLDRKGIQAGMSSAMEGPTLAIQVQNSLTGDASFDYSSYQAKTLDPGAGVTVNEPLHLKETKVEVDAPFTTKDGVPGQVKVTMHYALTWLITISGRDVPAVNYPVTLMGMKARSLDDLAVAAHATVVPTEREKFRSRLSFLQYLGGLIFKSEERRLYIAFQTSKEFEVDGQGTLLAPIGAAKVGYVTYELLSWRCLFK